MGFITGSKAPKSIGINACRSLIQHKQDLSIFKWFYFIYWLFARAKIGLQGTMCRWNSERESFISYPSDVRVIYDTEARTAYREDQHQCTEP